MGLEKNIKNLDILKVAIFDFDGVLFDTEGFSIDFEQKYFLSLGVKITREELYEFIGLSDDVMLKSMYEKHNLSLTNKTFYSHYEEKVEYFLNLKFNMNPDAHKFILFLKEKGIKVAIVSSSTKDVINKFLQPFDYYKLFDEIVTIEDVVNPKPAADPYNKVLEKMKLKPENCIIIEDSPTGINAGKAANAFVIAYTKFHIGIHDVSAADMSVKNLVSLKEMMVG